MKTNIIFDFSNLFHKSYHISRGFNTHPSYTFSLEDENNYARFIRKIFTDFASAVRFVQGTGEIHNVFICFDTDSFRKIECDKYKASRVKKEDAFYKAMDECFKIFTNKKMNALRIDGFEADDLVGLVAKKFKDRPDILNVIVSADEDVQQLVNDNTIVYNNNSQKRVFYIHHTFKSPEFASQLGLASLATCTFKSIWPFEILMQKVFLGCEGDEVPRLLPKGKGPSAINKILFKHNMLDAPVIDTDEIELQLIDMCQHLGLLYDRTEMVQQMTRVCLHEHYYPVDLGIEFEKLDIKPWKDIEMKMSNLLGDTKYIHYI